MNVSVEIQKIQKDLELLHDENIINSIKSLLSFAKKEKATQVLKSFTLDEYKERANLSEKDIKAGRLINIDDL